MFVLQTKVTPIVEGYGGWAFRMEIVPIESAYPGFGELVVSIIIENPLYMCLFEFLNGSASLSKLLEFLIIFTFIHGIVEQVLDSTDHINSCKPLSQEDPSYTETLEFLRKLKAHHHR